VKHIINTDQKIAETLNNGKILVLDQVTSQWLIFEDDGEEVYCSDDIVEIEKEQFQTLESLATDGAIYRNKFILSNKLMLLSYMSWAVAQQVTGRNQVESQITKFEA